MPATRISNPAPEELALMGFYLFPTNGKVPFARFAWAKESTVDIKTIQAWQKQYPGCSWAVDCGKSGLFVLDDDQGKNPEALKSFTALILEHGDLPTTFTVRTLSGGFHYYYYGEGRSTASSRLGPGLDTRSVGGYVIAPCSPGYAIVNHAPIVDVPEWLLNLAGRPADRKSDQTPVIDLDKEGAIILATRYLKSADPAIEGAGGDDYTVKTVVPRVKDYGVSETTCLELMLDHWNDRCCPPWSREELEVKVYNGYRYCDSNNPGAMAPELAFAVYEPTPADLLPVPAAPPRFKLMRSADVDKLPRLQWLVKGLIPTRGIFQVYGPSTTGKSFLMFDMLAAIAEGRLWFDRKTKVRTVLLVSLEGEAGLQQRKEAWEKVNGRTLPDNFLMMAEPWSVIKKQDIIDLARLVPKGTIVVIDTQNRAAPGINESASEDMGAVIQGAKILEREMEGVVGLIAHTGKDVTKGSRGHSSQLPAMDAAIETSRMGDIRQWRAVKVKDGRDGDSERFALPIIELGEDEDGEKITSCVVDREIVKIFDAGEMDLSETAAVAWSAVKFLASESRTGEVANGAWQAELAKQLGVTKDKKLQNRFYDARNELVRKGLVRKEKGLYVIGVLTEVDNFD